MYLANWPTKASTFKENEESTRINILKSSEMYKTLYNSNDKNMQNYSSSETTKRHMHLQQWRYLWLIFEKNFEIDITAKNRVGCHTLQKYFMHGNSLLECCQVFSETCSRWVSWNCTLSMHVMSHCNTIKLCYSTSKVLISCFCFKFDLSDFLLHINILL